MKIYKTRSGIVIEKENEYFLLKDKDWNEFINDDNLFEKTGKLIESLIAMPGASKMVADEIMAPVGNQELWACGVTYLRSKIGRQEESKNTGGADFYGRVYEAERPEIFFKATPHRITGHGSKVNTRGDSTWDVPEPELTLAVTSSGKIVGYTIGNDMSSRSIEGENPLYLPQAKTYDNCAAIGPCIYITNAPIENSTMIHMEISRNNHNVFEGSVGIRQMKRTLEELVSFVFRECTFPDGCLIMTGTGIVPPNDFTLQPGDEIRITIDNIGTLMNIVR